MALQSFQLCIRSHEANLINQNHNSSLFAQRQLHCFLKLFCFGLNFKLPPQVPPTPSFQTDQLDHLLVTQPTTTLSIKVEWTKLEDRSSTYWRHQMNFPSKQQDVVFATLPLELIQSITAGYLYQQRKKGSQRVRSSTCHVINKCWPHSNFVHFLSAQKCIWWPLSDKNSIKTGYTYIYFSWVKKISDTIFHLAFN